jgi:Uma2 family endonuclease
VLHRIGDVPLDRILAHPAPGEATPADVLRLCDGEPKRLCELVDGVLVEKAMGHRELRLAYWLGIQIGKYLEVHNLGILTGADGPYSLEEDQIRFPDVAFIAWNDIPSDADPGTPMPDWRISLAVEVISPGNTRDEMKRKLKDYFAAGVELVWYLYPIERVVRVYTSEEDCQTLTDADELDGGDVLPGFRVSVRELFDAGQLRRPTK